MDGETGAGEPASQRLAAQATGEANGLAWRQEFAGEERRLREMRVWLASVLPPCPARDDVLSVATELGANAIRHTASGHGGSFTVEIRWRPPALRVTVADGGGLTQPRVVEDPAGEQGRGLLLVRGLALCTGVDGGQDGRRVWAEVSWNGPEPRASLPVPDQRKTTVLNESPSRLRSSSPVAVACVVAPATTDLRMEALR